MYLRTCLYTAKKSIILLLLLVGYVNLAKVISVAAEWHQVTATLRFFDTLETDSMCAMCRVFPECKQSSVCYDGNVTSDW